MTPAREEVKKGAARCGDRREGEAEEEVEALEEEGEKQGKVAGCTTQKGSR